MSEREERIGRNEALFREVNERVDRLSKDFQLTDEAMGILCECGDSSCHEKIEITGSEYEAVRSDSTHFAVVPGHVAPDVETVIAENKRFAVVRKDEGKPAQLARELDARS